MISAASDMPLVTVVIPAYNHAGYLAQAVRSVLDQDYANLELIVINDGSTDDTAAVLAGLDGDFRWYTQPNSGQSATLTRGWSEARGEILGYLSADDVLDPSAVRLSVAPLVASPDLVATYPDFNLIDPASAVVRPVRTPDFDYQAMLADVICPMGPGAFFRRSAYLRAGPWSPDYRQMPDYDFWLRMGLTGRISRIPKILAGFRVHEGSQTYSVTTEQRADEPIRIIDGLLANPLASSLGAESVTRARVSALLVSSQLHLRAGRFRLAMQRFGAAVCMRWTVLFSPRTIRLLANALFNRIAHRLLWTVKALVRGRDATG